MFLHNFRFFYNKQKVKDKCFFLAESLTNFKILRWLAKMKNLLNDKFQEDNLDQSY